jgi:hypothetical protein
MPLAEAGVQHGDRGALLTNEEACDSRGGVRRATAGAVAVPVNPRYAARASTMLADSGARLSSPGRVGLRRMPAVRVRSWRG